MWAGLSCAMPGPWTCVGLAGMMRNADCVELELAFAFCLVAEGFLSFLIILGKYRSLFMEWAAPETPEALGNVACGETAWAVAVKSRAQGHEDSCQQDVVLWPSQRKLVRVKMQ